MNVERILSSGVETAFRLLRDLVGLGTFYQSVKGVPGDYDPDTDVVLAPISVKPDVRMILVSVEAEELVGTVVTVEDVKILIPASDLGILVPRAQDYLDLKGVRYNVIRAKPVPGNALHILFCRAA